MALIKSISGVRGTLGGKIGESLSPLDITNMTLAFGTWLLKSEPEKQSRVIIGRDARPSGKMISSLVSANLQSLGIDVIDLGLTTTPTLALAVREQAAVGGLMISASHNPNNWNALKLLTAAGFLSEQANAELLEIAAEQNYEFVEVKQLGKLIADNTAFQAHIDRICELEAVDISAIAKRQFKVVVDCVNSTGALIIPQLLERLGVQKISLLYDEVDGNFPHNPEPLSENLTALSNAVQQGDYDLGFAVDPDVDRLAIICNDGSPFNEEYSLVAVADYILSLKKGAVVSNLSSTQALKELAEGYGVRYAASKVGEANVVEVMKENQAVIGGEGNGGIIYPPLNYCRDAVVGIALFLAHLAHFEGSVKKLKSKYPAYIIVKNKIDVPNDVDIEDFFNFMATKYKDHTISRIDGLKITFDKEWIHIRRSNTEPIIRVYTESSSASIGQNLYVKVFNDLRDYRKWAV